MVLIGIAVDNNAVISLNIHVTATSRSCPVMLKLYFVVVLVVMLVFVDLNADVVPSWSS